MFYTSIAVYLVRSLYSPEMEGPGMGLRSRCFWRIVRVSESISLPHAPWIWPRLRRSFLWGTRQSFDDVFATSNAHNRHTINLPYPPLQVPIVGRNDVDLMFENVVDDAVIRIGSLVRTVQAFPSLVPCDLESDAVLWAEFLHLSHDAARAGLAKPRAFENPNAPVRDDGHALSIQTVHHG